MSDTAKRIAELEKELAESINGYISRKVIKGKERFYLNWSRPEPWWSAAKASKRS